jgi:3'(2'), 5'-bisphosphate nucleotidase
MVETIDLERVAAIAKEAGAAIMEIYGRDFDVEYKEDESPLTEADTRANEIICEALETLYPGIPMLSVEN